MRQGRNVRGPRAPSLGTKTDGQVFLVLNTRISQAEHDALVAMAERDRRSISNLIMVLLTPAITEYRKTHGDLREEVKP